MNVERHQAVIIGGGPAGLAAAIRLRQKGVDDVVVLEREHRPGGILRQCIHDGFGLTRFGETLSGPEYAQRFVAQAEELGITCLTDTTVLSLEADRTVTASGPAGLKQLRGDAVILTMGCRERTRGALAIRAAARRASTPPVWPRSTSTCATSWWAGRWSFWAAATSA